MKRTDKSVLAALRSLATGDKLDPKKVVDAARSKLSPLHEHFTWDDGEAAEQYRLYEARKLIAVHVEMLPGNTETTPVFVSLRSEFRKGGGYRTMKRVMSDEEMRVELLDAAMADLDYFRSKYHMLKELAAVFAAAKKVKRGR